MLFGILALVVWFAFPDIVAFVRGRQASADGERVLTQTGALFGFGWLMLSIATLLAGRWLSADAVAPSEVGPRLRGHRPLGITQTVALFAPAAFVLILGWARASIRSWSYDEILSLNFDLLRPYPQALAPHGVFANHLLAAALAKLIVAILGPGEATINAVFVLPPALAVLGATWLGWRATRSISRAALTGSLLALHPLLWHPGTMMRGYGLVLLGAVLVGMSHLEPPSEALRKAWTFLPLVGGCIAALAHLFGFLFVGVHLVALLFLARRSGASDAGASPALRRSQIAQSILALAIGWVAWLPSLPWAFFGTGEGPSVGEGGATRAGRELIELLAGGRFSPMAAVVAALWLVLALRGIARPGPLRTWCASGLSVVLLSSIAALVFTPTFFHARFMLVALPCWIVSLVLGLPGRRSRVLPVVVVLVAGEAALLQAKLVDVPNLRRAFRQVEPLRSTAIFRWCLDVRGEEGLVARHYAPAWIENCQPTDVESASGRAWVALAGGATERALRSHAFDATHQRHQFYVGDTHSDLVAWVPRPLTDGRRSATELESTP